MIIALIVAMADGRVIGKNNALPWHLPADLKHFKQCTLGKPVVMGRKTFESIGKPLPGRTNIIITRDAQYQAEGCRVVHSLGEALSAAQDAGEVMIIGGSQLFEHVLPIAKRIYLTEIHAKFAGDIYFPELMQGEWREVSRQAHVTDERNHYPYSFIVLERQHT
jgi:dihydrofolate reductase